MFYLECGFYTSFLSGRFISSERRKTLVKIEIKSIGLVINVLKKPTAADLDNSGSITGIEAFILGIALSLDAFGAGFGAALLGYSPYALAIAVALMSSLFKCWHTVWQSFSRLSWMKMFSFYREFCLLF